MSLAASLLQTAVTVGKEGLEKFEMRMPKNDTSIVRAFSKYTDQLVAPGTIERLKTSLRRPVQIPVFSNFAGTIGTVRKINPTPDVATTAMVPINFVQRTSLLLSMKRSMLTTASPKPLLCEYALQ